ncbi:MAG: adenosylcobinamide-GDP ribazoletransferase [Desulfobulbaceae bacterium]|nr:adenosylcobinamide-GDP ribazoletransferase [Desulfobulbaceae bacterium]HIJ77717.1 adenosylcobinamide-GDP ribazoletransferase [Deltaproteobacteria bacterium]
MFPSIRSAIAFLTILPIGLPHDLPQQRPGQSAAFFPLAGWVIGGVLAGGAWLAGLAHLPASVTAVLLVALSAWFTRGLHLDGWADLLDGLGGGFEPERRLAIMKDSATGAFGVIGLVLLLGLKVVCLAALIDRAGMMDLLLVVAAVPVVARWAMIVLCFKTRYPRQSGTGHSFVGQLGWRDLALGGLFVLPVLGWSWAIGLTLIAAGQLPGLWLRFKAAKALGGITGDVLGACCELGEACALLGVLFLFL